MVRRRKNQKKTRKQTTPLSVEELTEHGANALANKKYRDAVSHYNQLFKMEQTPQWRNQLGLAYHGRALELTAKGMHKEALVIWEHRAKVCQQPLVNCGYVLCLIAADKITTALQLLSQHFPTLQTEAAFPHLETQLASLLLTQSQMASQLPPGSALAQHCASAKQAIRAYAQGDPELDARLKQIPFRSPYKDLRIVLKALSILPEAPTKAAALVAKIPLDSGFFGLTQVVSTAAQPTRTLLAGMEKLNPAQQQAVLTLTGVDPAHTQMIKELQKLPEEKLFTFINRHRALLGQEKAKAMYLSLVPIYPRGYQNYVATFGDLPKSEQLRLRALTLEHAGKSPYEAVEQWDFYAQHLCGTGSDGLLIATVLRHMADALTPFAQEQRLRAEHLQASLKYDPEHKASHLQITEIYRKIDNKAFRQWADKTVKRYPTDADALMLVVRSANENKTYKKAANFAKKLLAIDPINREARDIVITSHIEHAQKQLQAEKLELAHKELDQAEQWDKQANHAARIHLKRGLLAVLKNDPTKAMLCFQTATTHIGELVMYFLLYLDALECDLDPNTTIRLAGLRVPKTATEEEVLTITRQAVIADDDDFFELDDLLDVLRPPLKKAAKLSMPVQSLRQICERLTTLDEMLLLKAYAQSAVKQWPNIAVFAYYTIVADTEGEPLNLKPRQQERLYDLEDQAREQGDQRAVELINDYEPFHGRMPFPFNLPF